MGLYRFFRKDNPFDYIVLGFIVRVVGDVAALFMNAHISGVIFGTTAWFLIIKGFAKIPVHLHIPFNKNYSVLFRFYLLLYIILIIRGYTIDYRYPWWTTIGAINMHIFAPTYLLCYLMPLSVLIPVKYFNFRLLLSYSVLFGILMLVSAFVFRQQIIQSSMLQAVGIMDNDLISPERLAFYSSFAFIPLFYKYIPSKKWLYNMFFLFVMLLLYILGGRRGASLMTSLLLFVSAYFYTSSQSRKARIIYRFIMIIVFMVLGYILLNSFVSDLLLERGLQDTRSGVEEGMLSQMTTFDKIFGMGLNGRYYYPLSDIDELEGWRYGIETGFYNLVLKGGYLLALTHILLLAIPSFKGLFKSRNLFCKAGGYFIFHHLLNLIPFGILSFNLYFFFIWMMVACCMNKQVLNMTDEEIKKQFFSNLR